MNGMLHGAAMSPHSDLPPRGISTEFRSLFALAQYLSSDNTKCTSCCPTKCPKHFQNSPPTHPNICSTPTGPLPTFPNPLLVTPYRHRSERMTRYKGHTWHMV